MGLNYCFLDIEVDGPTPGENSMLSLGFAAFDEDEREVGVFETNLETLEGARGAEDVMRWWRTQPEAWAYIRRDPVPPGVAMERCLDWLEGLGPDLALAAHPLLMDGSWLDWYLRRFCNATVFSGPFQIRCPFVGAGVDVPSYVQAALKMEYFTARPDYPPELLRDVPHTHQPVDDARGHAALYFSARRHARTRQAGPTSSASSPTKTPSPGSSAPSSSELNDEWAVSSRNVTLASIAPVSDNLTVKLSSWQLESPAPPAGCRLGREALTHGPRHGPTQRGGDKCPISTPEDAITSTRTQTQNRSTTTLVTAPSASELPVSRRPT